MKKKISVIGILLLCLIGVFISLLFVQQKNEQRKQLLLVEAKTLQIEAQMAELQKERQKNKEFIDDVIRILDRVYDSRGLEREYFDENNDYEVAYASREQLIFARDLISQWENDNNDARKEHIQMISEAIADLMEASDAHINLLKDEGDADENIALFLVKLESGREKLFEGAVVPLLSDENSLELAEEQKEEIVDYIDTLFGEEFEKYGKENRENPDAYSQPEEIWAASLIRAALTDADLSLDDQL